MSIERKQPVESVIGKKHPNTSDGLPSINSIANNQSTVNKRDIATPSESQIYNWGIKKDTSLDGVGRGNDRISYDVSSDVSNTKVPQKAPGVNVSIFNK